MPNYTQASFARGEIAPDLYGRTDIPQYKIGLKKARNAVIHQYGSISNRPGMKFIAPCKDHVNAPRLLPFQFKSTDTHVIEMGNEYFRFLRNDAHILEAGKSISAITQANPGVLTVVGHGYNTGDEVSISSIFGMTELNNQRFIVEVITVDTFSLKDQVTLVAIDTTGFTAYSSGGSTARVYTISSPYQQADLRDIRFVQTADIITLVHPSYPPKQLSRFAVDNWTLTDIVFRPTTGFPTNIATSGGSLGVDGFWQITAIDDNDNESLPGLIGTTTTITNITQSNPGVVASAAHGYTDGDVIQIDNVVGMTEVNTRRFTVANSTANTYELLGEDTTSFTAYVSGGTARSTVAFNTNTTGVTISWDSVSGAVRYRIFRKSSGVFGFIASTSGTSFTDPATVTPDVSDSPPALFEPFTGVDNYPAAVGFHQQRMIFGGSNNEPDTTYYSVVGDFNNFTHAIPFKDDDSFSTTLASEKINNIQHYTSSSKDLVILTSGNEWAIQGTDGTGRFSIDTVEQVPQTSWGSSDPRPIVIDNTVLFVTQTKHHIRSTAFSFQDDHYVAKELTLYVPHIFRHSEIVEWDYISDPDPIMIVIKEDGEAGVLTYNEQEEVNAWATWDTNGKFKSIAVIRPGINDSHEQAYFVIERKINGSTVHYIERTVENHSEDIRDAFFIDSGLSLDNPIAITDITLNNPIVIRAPSHGFANGDTVDIFDIVWQTVEDSYGNDNEPTTDSGELYLNNHRYYVANATTDTFTLQDIEDGSDINGTGFPTYIEGGTVREAFSTVSGLFHLKNTPVSVFADGNVVGDITVSSTGSVTLPRKFSRIHIGLGYKTDIETLPIELNPQGFETSVQGKLRKTNAVTLKLKETRGLWVGPDNTHLNEIKQREFEVMGDPTAMFTGQIVVYPLANWKLDGTIFLRQRDPCPFTLLAIIQDLDLED